MVTESCAFETWLRATQRLTIGARRAPSRLHPLPPPGTCRVRNSLNFSILRFLNVFVFWALTIREMRPASSSVWYSVGGPTIDTQSALPRNGPSTNLQQMTERYGLRLLLAVNSKPSQSLRLVNASSPLLKGGVRTPIP